MYVLKLANFTKNNVNCTNFISFIFELKESKGHRKVQYKEV